MPTRRTKKPDEIIKLFAERLREVRLSREMTQLELASQAKVSPTYISELENGDIPPGIDLVDRLAQALGSSVAGLFTTPAEPDPMPVLKEQARRLRTPLYILTQR